MSSKIKLVGLNPIVATSIGGDSSKAVLPNGKKVRLIDEDKPEWWYIDRWKDEDGNTYLSTSNTGRLIVRKKL